MGDQLEKFIMENRSAFDEDTPSENAWNQIDSELKEKGTKWVSLWKVAAVIFMVSTLYLIVDRNTNAIEEGPVLTEEFNQAENYYINLISEKRQIIAEQLTPEQNEQFLVEIDQLDELYLELKKTYQTNASNDRVMDAMINNLQLRLEILDKQLEILQKIKNQNNEKDSSIEI